MSKKIIVIALIAMIVALGGISLYTTFAYDAEAAKLDESSSDYNLIYSLKDISSNQVHVLPKETKYIDIALKNTYTATVRYAVYYRVLNGKNAADLTLSLAEESQDSLQDTIGANEDKVVSVKIVNNSDNEMDLVVGSVVGFENGNVEDLLEENEMLVK